MSAGQVRAVGREAYQLTDAELTAVEDRLVALLDQYPAVSGLATVFMTSDNPFADFVRTYEATIFGAEAYDFYAGMRPYEQASFFLMTVDMTNKVVAHVKRVVEARKELDDSRGTGPTGIEVIDDRLSATTAGERVTLPEIVRFHRIADIRKSINLTSNIQTGRCLPSWEKPYSLISYKAAYKVTKALGIENIFAYMNRGAIKSLGRLGVVADRLAGREFHLPMPGEPGRYDPDYEAVCIPVDRHNLDAFTTVDPTKPFTRLIAGLEVPLYWLDGMDVSFWGPGTMPAPDEDAGGCYQQ